MAQAGYARPDLLTETDWLEQHLDDPDLRIVDCDPYDAYRRAHIKGAVGIRVHHYIKQPEYPTDPRKYPLVAPPDTAREVLESLGIGEGTRVVAYDSNGSLWAARLWWVLRYYGHTEVTVLNGGWQKWFDEGRPTTLDVPAPASATFHPKANPDWVCTVDYGAAHVGNPDVVFLDVRSDGEWTGANNRGNRRAGRIPGAVHLEWLNFVHDKPYRTFKEAGELRSLLEQAGVPPDREVVTY